MSELNEQPSGEIRTLYDLLGRAQDAEGTFRRKAWYRGERSSARGWKLRPLVFRDQRYAAKEQSMLGRFMMRAPMYRERCPGNREFAVWLTLARHYGLPTRLLDWTESILVAAFFALCDDGRSEATKGAAGSPDCPPGAPDDDAVIWALNPYALNAYALNQSPWHAWDVNPLYAKPASKVVLAAFGRKEEGAERILAGWPQYRDARMLVQQSTFTVHGCPEPLEELKHHETFLRKYTIPTGAKGQLRKELASVGYTEASMYPDLEHLAQWLKDEAAAP